MRYNAQKFQTMVDLQHQLHGALQKAEERRRGCMDSLRKLRGQSIEWKNDGNNPLPKHLETAMREAENELRQLTEASERARTRWQEHSAIVGRCEEFLRSKGVRVPQVLTFTHGDGGMPR
jgi:hypothetical protein